MISHIIRYPGVQIEVKGYLVSLDLVARDPEDIFCGRIDIDAALYYLRLARQIAHMLAREENFGVIGPSISADLRH